ncbi:5-formyltetrahydrofolate cyclo-ligase [Lacisediminimonas sp.]|uniref:5-formyltetrahydrofolate cyclo-ligase n=1 Tax=Lacisediminimonas sp. TaxID=3060582 RepID=UPI00271EF5EA|nr:5-formyltetrahydrofolate cyclo-ligase [Lacisediminimonas sp.]MDO8299003.1 5-formyltetrahydrofolate cyclo-ligase [Lacisediminimonas sp.]MDO9216899.1 5-formyltetrahydrofolate cyclo-ligase [Lacisediminimonas sp.]
MSNKTDLRVSLLMQRRAMSPDSRAGMDRAMCDAVLAWCKSHSPTVLGVYMPMRGEPDLAAAYAQLIRDGMQLALPVVVQRDAPLVFAAWTPGQPTTRDLAGAQVPAPPQQLVEPDTLLIPCLGYSRARYRLGYGAGYYDRTLAERPQVHSIGIAWAGSEVEFAPDSYDLPMQAVITEAGLR